MQQLGHHRIAIVGSGFSGLGMAIRLKQEGIEDFVVLERAEELGGTWRDNTYPGCACDVPSHLYSFSFAPNSNWSRTFSRQPEIWAYLRRTAREHGVDAQIRYRHEVTSARWDATRELWLIETSAGELTASMLVAGAGPLADPKLPEIDGIEDFEGEIFHSARWNHEHSIEGERVAVIGTGASSIQLIPQIQPKVGKLHVFQRTAPWVTPQRDRPIKRWEQRLYSAFPPAQKVVRGAIYCARELFVIPFMRPREGSPPERIARRHLRAQVSDPELRAKLEPNYRIGCKRILISDSYYPALQQPNAEVVTDAIAKITPRGIVTADGVERELDTIILGTGFYVADPPFAELIHDADGRSLTQAWAGSPQAYLGAAVHGFPNMFMLVGPNTGLGHNSIVFMIESQLHYLMAGLRYMEQRGLEVIEVREHVQQRYDEEIQRKLQGTVWESGGCASWYRNEHGKNTTIWPGSTWPFRRRLRTFDPGDYVLRRRAASAGAAGSHATSAVPAPAGSTTATRPATAVPTP
ncbi:MAG TPA: NAD(P)/FAD-dependent oxidoreductase [Solirubrobacteraceae bacterium]|jgi:cation diffusion facilitator CzcD-associated flavoprotein CzcO|nr:NAD(P)/FAD-dependent oxidoreductase [Solirubrobacteraceae bacterium]